MYIRIYIVGEYTKRNGKLKKEHGHRKIGITGNGNMPEFQLSPQY